MYTNMLYEHIVGYPHTHTSLIPIYTQVLCVCILQTCDVCCTLRESSKQLSIASLPNLLVIQLKRFNAYTQQKVSLSNNLNHPAFI